MAGISWWNLHAAPPVYVSDGLALSAVGALPLHRARAPRRSARSDAALGIRAALERGAAAAVALLGRTGGFLGNPKVRIPLPGFLERRGQDCCKFTGQQQRVDELVTAMNRAAELAVPEAKTLLVNAVRSMSVEDARRIVTGGDDSVTQFFADKTRAAARRQVPADRHQAPPSGSRSPTSTTPSPARPPASASSSSDDANIQQYVTGKALDGLYLMIGEEEKKIRRDPVGTGSAILKKVFGSLR